jgi:hypothetical protein
VILLRPRRRRDRGIQIDISPHATFHGLHRNSMHICSTTAKALARLRNANTMYIHSMTTSELISGIACEVPHRVPLEKDKLRLIRTIGIEHSRPQAGDGSTL